MCSRQVRRSRRIQCGIAGGSRTVFDDKGPAEMLPQLFDDNAGCHVEPSARGCGDHELDRTAGVTVRGLLLGESARTQQKTKNGDQSMRRSPHQPQPVLRSAMPTFFDVVTGWRIDGSFKK